MLKKRERHAIKFISSQVARQITEQRLARGVTLATLLKWVARYKLGRQYGEGGRWYIDEEKLMQFLAGEIT